MSSVLAVFSLFLAAAFVPVVGAALLVLILLGVFVLALVGVLGRIGDRTVHQHDPVLDPRGWRDGS